MPELLENQTGDFAKSGARKRIHKIPAHIKILYIFLRPKERKLRVPNEVQFSDRLGTVDHPMTFRAQQRDKFLGRSKSRGLNGSSGP
jgi:hypothetical protein